MSKKFTRMIIGTVTFGLVMMVVAIVVLAMNNKQEGHMDVRSWDIKIYNVSTIKSEGAYDVVTPMFTDSTLKFDVRFQKPGDFAIYNVKIKNYGLLDAVVSYIDFNEGLTNPYIKYSIDGIYRGMVIKRGMDVDISIKVEYIDTDSLNYNNKPLYVNFGFVQKA